MQASELPSLQDWSGNPLWKAIRFQWYWFVISPLLCIMLGLVFLRYKTPRYSITASLLVRDDSRGGDFRETALLEELGLPDVASSVENEIEILQSRTLLGQVSDDLHLTTQYFASGRFKTAELYEKTPFTVKFLKQRTFKPGTYHIERGRRKSFTLHNAVGESFEGTFGNPLCLPHGLVIIDTTRFQPSTDYAYSFSISTKEAVLEHYSHVLNVQPTNKAASLVNLSIQEVLPRKGEAILKQLIYRYQKASIEEKNRVSDSTIAFINHNLNKISDELLQIETGIEQFRKQHRVIDVAEDTRLALQKLRENVTEEKELAIRLEVIEALETHLHQKPLTAIPTTLYSQESSFYSLVTKYNEMQLHYVRSLASLAPQHPELRSINNQIELIRNNLSDAIQYQKRELTLSISAIREYVQKAHAEIAQIPGRQRQFLSQSREQGIQQELYLFLLKKRMETAISRSATIANARIIDPPKAGSNPTYPNRQLTLVIALLGGFLAPAATLYIRLIFNDKVTSKEDISNQCDIAIIGEISQQSRRGLAEKPNSRSLVSEQFRSLRTNIQFTDASRGRMVILLTSAMANEGKSFVAVRLAQSLALACRKVLLVDLDLRKPTLARVLKLQSIGVYESLAPDGQLHIQQYGAEYPFDFLASGECPSGPGEVLLSSKVGELISTLRNRYDYILLDSPPVGLVADALELGRHADMTLYIIRQHFTFRHQLPELQKLHKEARLPSIHIVLNGTTNLHQYQYNYY